MLPDFFVVSTPAAGGERFAILRRETMPIDASLWVSPGNWLDTLSRWVQAAPLVSELDLRAQLAEMGLSTHAIETQIERARRMHTLNEQMPTTWERTTRIGYRNEYGQEVIRKTQSAGTVPDRPVFVLRCGDCAHEYGANGSEIHSRRCPQCRGDSPPRVS